MSDGKSCKSCGKTEPEIHLKKCAKCLTEFYCSRVCQKSDWKGHKKVCGKMAGCQQPSSSTTGKPQEGGFPGSSPAKGLDLPISKPFTRLNNGTWLHDRPEQDVYRLLVDVHRMRIEDEYVFEGDVSYDTLYGEGMNPNPGPNILCGFRRFLRRVASRPGLLPPWWNPSKQAECEVLAMDPKEWPCLLYAVEKSDIIDHYGDGCFPMQLRMFGEAVYGNFPGGSSGAAMRAMMMQVEQNDMHVEAVDLSSMGIKI